MIYTNNLCTLCYLYKFCIIIEFYCRTEIRLGDWDLAAESDCQSGDDGEQCAPPHRIVKLEDAIIHPNYSRRYQYSDDIALIRLSQPLDLAEVAREF